MGNNRKRENPDAVTEKGTFLLAVDRKRLFTSKRHTDQASMTAEAKRLAKDLKQRVLVLKVVGVVDERAKAAPPAPPDEPTLDVVMDQEKTVG